MGDNWDDSDDDWDVGSDDDELDKRLGLATKAETIAPTFDDEEDLAVKEKAIQEKLAATVLKKKGNALNEKKKERARKERGRRNSQKSDGIGE